MDQGMQVAPGSGKGKGTDSAWSPQRGTRPCLDLGFSLVRPVSDSSSIELYDNKFVLFEATKFVIICSSSHRNLITLPNTPLVLLAIGT